jgi:hypothetical protein
MEKSESITKLSTALSVFQGKMASIGKDSTNPFFRMKYASLTNIWDTIREPLAANGLSVVQGAEHDLSEGHIVVETMLMHVSGEFVSTALPIKPVRDEPQGMGSALTYARRYGLSAILGLVTDEDDDAETAQKRTQQTPVTQKAPFPQSASVPAPTAAVAQQGGSGPIESAPTPTATVAGASVSPEAITRGTSRPPPVSMQAIVNMAKTQGYDNNNVSAILMRQFHVSKLQELAVDKRPELLQILTQGRMKVDATNGKLPESSPQ